MIMLQILGEILQLWTMVLPISTEKRKKGTVLNQGSLEKKLFPKAHVGAAVQ